nr:MULTISPECIES: GIY-YIG nuclease family protein [unclassified Sphingomonas]
MGVVPDGPVKIGTTYDLPRRLRHIQAACPYEVALLADFPGSYGLEAELHEGFRQHRLKGEWFTRAPEILEKIEQLRQENVS